MKKPTKKGKTLSLKKLAAKNPRLQAKVTGNKDYIERMSFFSESRSDEWGKNLTSKFLKVIHDKLGETRQDITKALIKKRALKPVKNNGKIDYTETAKKLNFAFEGMQKKNLIRKEEIRNKDTGEIQTRNCRYSLTKFGQEEYEEKIKPNFKSWGASA